MHTILRFLLLTLLLSACQSRKERMSHVWFFSVADFSDDSSKEPNYAADAANPMILSPESFLDLQKDGAYTSYFGRFAQGRWEVRGNELRLMADNNKVQTFQVRYAGRGQLILFYPERDVQYSFEGHDNHFKDAGENPFSRNSNGWRIRPLEKETDARVGARLKNYFHFCEQYFAWALKNKLTSLKVDNLPGPLEIYSNGFRLTPFEKEPYEWQNHFFDAQDAKKAYDLLEGIFMHGHIHWEETGNRFAMFVSAFRQLQQQIP